MCFAILDPVFLMMCRPVLLLQVQSWTYGPKTRTVRAAARSARDAGVRVRELKPEELTDDLKHRLQHEISGERQDVLV
jgi:hypothetical protein